MAKPPTTDHRNLERRYLTWHCVMDVPRPLRVIIGKKRLVKSLQTHDLTEARNRRHKVLADFVATIHAARAGAKRPNAYDPVTAEAIATAAPGSISVGDGLDETEDQLLREQVIADRAEVIGELHGPAAGRSYLGIATGTATPVGLHVHDWLAQSRYSGRSQSQHHQAIRELTAWCVSSKSPTDAEGITRKVAGLFIAAAAKTGQNPKTVNRKLATLRAYWGWMIQRGHLKGEDPWKGQSLQTQRANGGEETADCRPFTDTELSQLLSGSADRNLQDFMRIAALSGARIGEIAGLKVGDCDDGEFNIRASKTNSGKRKTPIHTDLAGLIDARRNGRKDGEWLFPDLTTRPTGERSMGVSQKFGRYRKSLGVADNVKGKRGSLVNFHSFRHWFITAAFRAGQPEHIIQQVVGHKRKGVTLGVYHGGDTRERLKMAVESVTLPQAIVAPR